MVDDAQQYRRVVQSPAAVPCDFVDQNREEHDRDRRANDDGRMIRVESPFIVEYVESHTDRPWLQTMKGLQKLIIAFVQECSGKQRTYPAPSFLRNFESKLSKPAGPHSLG